MKRDISSLGFSGQSTFSSSVEDILNVNSSALDSINLANRASDILGSSSLFATQSTFLKVQDQINQRNAEMAEIFQDFSSQKYLTSLSCISDQISSLSILRPSTLATIEQITNSNRFVETLGLHSKLTDQYKELQERYDFTNVLLSQSNAINELSATKTLETFKALTELKNSPYSYLPEIRLPFAKVLPEYFDESIVEIDTEVRDELSSASDYESLSEKAKKALDYFFHHYLLPLILSVIAAYVVIQVEEAKKELQQVSTPAEVRKFVRTPSYTFDKTSLKGYRVTTAKMLNFRNEPSMNSEIIAELPIGTLVEVVEKSNRSWLYVETEVDGELEQGWVSRRYTVYFK